MAVTVQWLGHASFKLSGSKTVFIDPWKLPADAGKADVVIVSHSHYDHCSPEDVASLRSGSTTVLAPQDCIEKLGSDVTVVTPGESHSVGDVRVEVVPAYNIGKDFHPRPNNWIGVVVTLDGKRVYYAGDTDKIPEMDDLQDIDLALLPVGGTYTMDAQSAAEAAKAIGPRRALPYHWGDIVGDHGDADAFKAQAGCDVTVLSPGGSLPLD